MNNNSRDKLSRLFQFVKKYNEVNHTVVSKIESQIWHQYLDELPDNELITCNLFGYKKIKEISDDLILSIGKPQLSNCPDLPKEIVKWIDGEYKNPNKNITYKKRLKYKNPNYDKDIEDSEEVIIEQFDESLDRVNLYNEWNEKRKAWATIEIELLKIDKMFNNLYGLYSQIKKEEGEVELVIGDGFIRFEDENITIDHPTLLQVAKLEFDSQKPQFSILRSDKPQELYRDIFTQIKEKNHELLESIYKEFEDEKVSPMDDEKGSSFLIRLANSISHNSRFIDYKQEQIEYGSIEVYRRPVMFLRKRKLGIGVAIDSILEDINTSKQIPEFLYNIIDEDKKSKDTNDMNNKFKFESDWITANGIDKDVLLTKTANEEQLRVVKYLEHRGGVLVQGPPGTGKTHTIANIIGHLLSQGKSILVTSQKEKALAVLKEKVVDELKPLCLNLASSKEGKEELKYTIDGINEKRSNLDIDILNDKVESLEKQRNKEIDKLKQLKLKLKEARLGEHNPIVIQGEEIKPIDAAKFIFNNKDKSSIIPTPIVMNKNIPLTNEEIKELYQSNITVPHEVEIEFENNIPCTKELIKPLEFEYIIRDKNKYDLKKLERHTYNWNKELKKEDIKVLKQIITELKEVIDSIDIDNKLAMETINAGRIGKNNKWKNLIENIDLFDKLYMETDEMRMINRPEIDLNKLKDIDDIESELTDIIDIYESKSKIKKFIVKNTRNYKLITKNSKLDGKSPQNLEDFKNIRQQVKYLNLRNDLMIRWDRQLDHLDVNKSKDIVGNNEYYKKDKVLLATYKKYRDNISENLKWYEKKWNIVSLKLKSQGLDINKLGRYSDLSADEYGELKYIKRELYSKIVDSINSKMQLIEYKNIESERKRLENVLSKYDDNSELLNKLKRSVKEENIELYKESYDFILNMEKRVSDIISRKRLIGKLSKDAQQWANAIKYREGIHGEQIPPQGLKESWLYHQYDLIIKERNEISIEKIQSDILSAENSIKLYTSQLASNKAWLSKIEELQKNKDQVRVLESWRKITKSIGQGKGKNAPKLKEEARKLMPKCQKAIPVWIMPLSNVVENFNPKENKFDVVIIDEASQANITSLPALYLGKKVIIVGDDEQVTPLAVAEDYSKMEGLRNEYLYDNHNKELYTGQLSLYDIAKLAAYQPVTLKEHFRCVPDIIQYCNRLSYGGNIKPLRDVSDVKIKPSVIPYRVIGATQDKSKVNYKEVEAIVSLILSCCENEEYRDKTIGVISLTGKKSGDKHMKEIDKMLQSKMNPSEYEKRNIVCGDAANFQGDERDVIFLSMITTNEGEGPIRKLSETTDEREKKRFNVAVSRAKDQIWLVHSLDSENDLKEGDLRKELIEYFKDYKSRSIEYEIKSKKAESPFEEDVMKHLIYKGYDIIPQWYVGSYRIDMVARYEDRKIAIECDGEKWHGEDKLEEDMNRQSILERLGWKFIRIRGSEFYKDKKACMERVIHKLEEYNIYQSIAEENKDICKSELKDNVIRRSHEMLDEWNSENEDDLLDLKLNIN